MDWKTLKHHEKVNSSSNAKTDIFGKNDKKRYLLPKRTATHHIVAGLRLEFQQSLQNRLASYNLRTKCIVHKGFLTVHIFQSLM